MNMFIKLNPEISANGCTAASFPLLDIGNVTAGCVVITSEKVLGILSDIVEWDVGEAMAFYSPGAHEVCLAAFPVEYEWEAGDNCDGLYCETVPATFTKPELQFLRALSKLAP